MSNPSPLQRGFVVNLPQHTDKRQYMEAQLAAVQALQWEIVNGVDGNSLPASLPQVNQDLACQVIGRPLAAGEVGCTLSHLGIHRQIIANGIPGAVVLEDDATLLSLEFPEIDFTVYDVVLLGGTVLQKVAHQEVPFSPGPVLVSALGPSIYGSFGYAISNAGATKMLDAFSEIAFPIDSWHILRKQGIRIGRTVPFIVQVNLSFPSAIEPERKKLQKEYK